MEELLYLGDVEVVQFKGQTMRRGEQRFDLFFTNIKRYEHVEEDTFDLILTNKQKVRVELLNDGARLVLKKLLNKNTLGGKTNEKRDSGKGKKDAERDELQARKTRQSGNFRDHRRPYRSQRIERESVDLESAGPDQFLGPIETLERWAKEKGIRFIWQSRH